MNTSIDWQDLKNHSSPQWASVLEQLLSALESDGAELPQDWAELILSIGSIILEKGTSEQQYQLLEAAWRPAFSDAVHHTGITEDWFQIELSLIRKLNYTPGTLFLRRAAVHPERRLFSYKQNHDWIHRSWGEIRTQVENLASGLFKLTGKDPGPVAIFSENRIEVALTDILCLTTGVVNVPLQVHATQAQLAFILNHAEVETIIVSTHQLLQTVEAVLPSTPKLKHIICFETNVYSRNPIVSTFNSLWAESDEDQQDLLEKRNRKIKLADLASIMYTSGTTGYPKGIQFSHENVIAKRFARGLVLPLGENDRFISFLPLFHTFGRYLEMWGCIYWGANYIFASGQGIHSLATDIADTHPTVLISIPKRWQELYDRIHSRIDPETVSPEQVSSAVQHTLGGKLRWGLSAAGYLDPAVFRFFQAHGVHLHSGYGMTEATGGITMTPRDDYLENSIGKALPGIELKLGEDGEMFIRGSYVSDGYWKDEEESREDGWFTTGDIFTPLENGQYEIVDRKKEIYKNVQGQTIAPQKIENMFREFDSVQQLFVVGDHRPYNTALIVLDRSHRALNKLLDDDRKLKDYVGSLIHSVNAFLAPFERIVSFAILDEPFSTEAGELTSKGTFKRQVIQQRYAENIDKLYLINYKSYLFSDIEIRIPTWFFRHRGWTRRDLFLTERGLEHPNGQDRLRIERIGEAMRIGDVVYHVEGDILNMEEILQQPAYWIGNPELESFINAPRLRIKMMPGLPSWLPARSPALLHTASERRELEDMVSKAMSAQDFSINSLMPALRLLYSGDLELDHPVFRMLSMAQRRAEEPIRQLIAYAYLRLSRDATEDMVRHSFLQLAGLLSVVELEKITPFVLSGPRIFTDWGKRADWPAVTPQKVELFIRLFARSCEKIRDGGELNTLLENQLGILISLSKQYPRYYDQIRTRIVRCRNKLHANPSWQSILGRAFEAIYDQFREKIGVPASQAVLPDEGISYEWDDVLSFDPSISPDHRQRIRQALTETSLLNETIYLFFKGQTLRLMDIPPEGIWIAPIASAHGKSVYRVSVRTRELRTLKFALNVSDELNHEEIEQELRWLITIGHENPNLHVVERVGAYVPELRLWSEEFIPGYTVAQYLRLGEWGDLPEEHPDAEYIWPHFAWTGIYTFAKVWQRSGYQFHIETPLPDRVIIPIHDYHIGGKLVSLANSKQGGSAREFMEAVNQYFLKGTLKSHPNMDLELDPDLKFHAVYEALEPQEATKFFEELEADKALDKKLRKELEDFLEKTQHKGNVPKSVYFAIRRYHRWISLNQDATLKAKAGLLKNLYHDYKISLSERDYPDARVRLFLETVFKDHPKSMVKYLRGLMKDLRIHRHDTLSLQTELSNYVRTEKPDEADSFFLKRIAFPELPPADQIDLIATRSTALDDVEIMISRRDQMGQSYRIRRAMTPKEIIQLKQLFDKSNLPVDFSQEHEYLVALNENGRVIGGLFFMVEEESIVYLDKVVVSQNYRSRGLSRGIIEEFLNRMRNRGYKIIITGFLHPGFFYKFGFQIESNQAGLVKYL